MKTLETICSLAGWALFLTVGVGFAMQHGKRWEFGPHGVTQLLVAEDGEHYRDGTPIDQFTLGLHKAGQYETCQFVMLGIFGALFAYLVFMMRRHVKESLNIYRRAYEDELAKLRDHDQDAPEKQGTF